MDWVWEQLFLPRNTSTKTQCEMEKKKINDGGLKKDFLAHTVQDRLRVLKLNILQLHQGLTNFFTRSTIPNTV
jgi:hypothetical protein